MVWYIWYLKSLGILHPTCLVGCFTYSVTRIKGYFCVYYICCSLKNYKWYVNGKKKLEIITHKLLLNEGLKLGVANMHLYLHPTLSRGILFKPHFFTMLLSALYTMVDVYLIYSSFQWRKTNLYSKQLWDTIVFTYNQVQHNTKPSAIELSQ